MDESDIKAVMEDLADSFDKDLLALSAEEIAAEWYWSWDAGQSVEWNTYQFSDILELHKRRWRRWEEHHNGSVMVVERVRDRYVMPRVREFLAALAKHSQDQDAKEPEAAFTHPQATGDRCGCHVEVDIEGVVLPECVLDEDRSDQCIHAEPGMQREQCPFWKPVGNHTLLDD
ncbi:MULTISPECIES: hypothetical protein [unclassified Thioalkalivibrio]|uniref:hypothetical protein n=1 Tax=unclassified Thioalkalivibrio TaxID=2621013 RepID=UPI001E52E8CE|nr:MULTISPECIES: hypothetical protein [unclassified Thioalkalivibrio]